MPGLSEVLRQLPALAPSELEQIRIKASALLSLTASKQIDSSPPIDYLLEGMYTELRRRGVLGTSSRPPVTSAYAKASADVRRRLEHHLGPLSAAEKMALGQVVAEALADYLSRVPGPLSVKRMMINMPAALTALEAAFPGYLVNGLLPMLWGWH